MFVLSLCGRMLAWRTRQRRSTCLAATATLDATSGGQQRFLVAPAYDAFLKKWTTLCPAVARSIEEAGLDLLTFYQFPKSMWKSLRTTNRLENLNREFRRRTKTQASFSTDAPAVTLLFGLVAFGQIVLRRIDGHAQPIAALAKEWSHVA